MTSGVRGMPRILTVLALLTALAPLSIDIYLPSLPAMRDDLGGAEWLAQASITGCLLGIAVGQLICGPLSDRFGRRPVVLVGVIGWTIASGLSAVVQTAETLVAVRVLVGVCGAAGIVVARSIVRDVSCDMHETSSRIGLLSTVTAVAPVIAPTIGAGIAVLGGWRADFVALAAVGATLSLAFALTVPETMPSVSRGRGQGVLAGLASALRHRELAAVTAMMLAYGIGFYAYIATASLVVVAQFGHPPIVFALVFGTNAVAMLGSNLLFRRVVRRVHPALPLGIGLGMSVLAGGLGLVVSSAGWPEWMLWAASLVFTAGAGLVLPGTHSWGQVVGVASGAASALTGAAQFFGGALGSPLTGLVGVSALSLSVVVSGASVVALGLWAVGRVALVR